METSSAPLTSTPVQLSSPLSGAANAFYWSVLASSGEPSLPADDLWSAHSAVYDSSVSLTADCSTAAYLSSSPSPAPDAASSFFQLPCEASYSSSLWFDSVPSHHNESAQPLPSPAVGRQGELDWPTAVLAAAEVDCVAAAVISAAPAAVESSLDVRHVGRAARRRGTHRLVDERRRREEGLVLQRLAELTSSGERQDDGSRGRTATKALKARKLAVLQASAERIEELQRLCGLLLAARTPEDTAAMPISSATKRRLINDSRCASSDEDDSTVSNCPTAHSIFTLSDCVNSALDDLSSLDARLTLRRSRELRDCFNQVLIDVSTGCVLEVNSHFQRMTGWSRADMLGRSAGTVEMSATQQPKHDEMATGHAQPLAFRSLPLDAQRRWVNSPRPLQQYPSALQGRLELWMGLRRSWHDHWRVRFADGHAYEIKMLMALHSYDEEQLHDGLVRIKPLRVRIVSGYEAPVKLHDL